MRRQEWRGGGGAAAGEEGGVGVAAASEKGDGFGAAAEGGTARLSEGGESRGRRRVRECKRIRSCWGRNCARGWNCTPNTSRHWRMFPIPIPRTTKQLISSSYNTNSKFQPSIPTSKRNLFVLGFPFVPAKVKIRLKYNHK